MKFKVLRQVGGDAFPTFHTDMSCGGSGMSLLDWFAGQALAGMMAGDGFTALDDHEAADIAYDLAESMVAESRRRQEAKDEEVE